MIKNGVALVRLASNSPDGCAGGVHRLEEFYVVVRNRKMLSTRFMSYAAAYRHLEKLRDLRADVA